MSTALFGKNVEPACRHCESAIQQISPANQILCSRLGVVSADYHCKRYAYDPIKRIPKPQKPLPEFSAEDFSIE
ncbi:MAG: hypothetical protein FWH00_02650 [Oscillospiraceae bacterium]|nr:hypothetical protein [Oscillospiraceae bacterium]